MTRGTPFMEGQTGVRGDPKPLVSGMALLGLLRSESDWRHALDDEAS